MACPETNSISLSLTLVHPRVPKCPSCPPPPLEPSSRNSTRPFFATVLTRLFGKEGTDVKATSNRDNIRIQVCFSLFSLCRIQLGITGKAVPLQNSAIPLYCHSC